MNGYAKFKKKKRIEILIQSPKGVFDKFLTSNEKK